MATGLIRRNGRYSIRRIIPTDLQPHYGRREIVRALGTATPTDARRLHARAWVQLDDEFDLRRAAISGHASPERATIQIKSIARPVPDPIATPPGNPLREVVDRWAGERKPIERTARRTRNIVDRFEAVNGKLDVQAVTKQHVLAFKDALFQQGRSPANINVMIPMLGVVMNFAIANDLMASNPADGIRVADNRRAKEKRRAFDEAEVKAIFSSPVYSQGARPGDAPASAARP